MIGECAPRAGTGGRSGATSVCSRNNSTSQAVARTHRRWLHMGDLEFEWLSLGDYCRSGDRASSRRRRTRPGCRAEVWLPLTRPALTALAADGCALTRTKTSSGISVIASCTSRRACPACALRLMCMEMWLRARRSTGVRTRLPQGAPSLNAFTDFRDVNLGKGRYEGTGAVAGNISSPVTAAQSLVTTENRCGDALRSNRRLGDHHITDGTPATPHQGELLQERDEPDDACLPVARSTD
jgi:hypothetical protein